MRLLNQRKRGRKEGRKEGNGPRDRCGGAKTDPYRLHSCRERMSCGRRDRGGMVREVRGAGEMS